MSPAPQTPTGALPLDPAGGLPSPDPSFIPRSKFLATPLTRNDASSAEVDTQIALTITNVAFVKNKAKKQTFEKVSKAARYTYVAPELLDYTNISQFTGPSCTSAIVRGIVEPHSENSSINTLM